MLNIKKFLLGQDVSVAHKNEPLVIVLNNAFIANIFRNSNDELMAIVVDKGSGAFIETAFLQLRLKNTKVLQNMVTSFAETMSDFTGEDPDIERFELMDFSSKDGLFAPVEKKDNAEKVRKAVKVYKAFEEGLDEDDDDYFNNSPTDDIPF